MFEDKHYILYNDDCIKIMRQLISDGITSTK